MLDADETVLLDPRVHAATGAHVARILTEPYTRLTGLYRPLTTLSYLFNYSVLGNGVNPSGYHWFNFALHALNTALVYSLALAAFEQIPLALLASAIWSLHPVQTEGVTNIVGRADMLAAFGVLAALFCHRRALKSIGAVRVGWIVAMAVAMGMGICAKESAITALAIIPLYDLTFERNGRWRSRVSHYLALAIPCAAFLLIRGWVLARAPTGPFPFVDNPLTGASFLVARLGATEVIGKYLLLLIWPARLSYDYSYNEVPVAASAAALLSLGVCIGAVTLAIYSYRRHRVIFFFSLFFFVTLGPVSNLILLIGTMMGERLLYLPSVGFAGCIAYAIGASTARASRFRLAWVAGVGMALVALAARTYARNDDWLDPERFWTSGMEAAPNSFKTNLNFGKESMNWPDKNWPRAIAAADRALGILDPLPPLENVGVAYREAAEIYGRYGDSAAADRERWYRKALDALLRSERIELAKDQRDRTLNAKRSMGAFTDVPSILYLQMGLVYMRLNEPNRAIAALERGRVLDPNAELLERLGEAYASAGDPHKAAAAFIEAMALDPARAGLASKVIELYRQIDPQSCAADAGGGLNLGCPMIHAEVCAAARNVIAGYTGTRQNFAAEDVRRTAIRDLGCANESLR